MPVTIETPPRRPRVPSHPRTAQTPPPLSRSLRYLPSPLAPSPTSLLVTSSTPIPLPKPPSRESTRTRYRSADEFEVLRILRGVLLTTRSSAITLALSLPLLSALLFLSRSLSVPRGFESNSASFYSVSSQTPLFPSFTPPSIFSTPPYSLLKITLYWISVCSRYHSPFTRDLVASVDLAR